MAAKKKKKAAKRKSPKKKAPKRKTAKRKTAAKKKTETEEPLTPGVRRRAPRSIEPRAARTKYAKHHTVTRRGPRGGGVQAD